ncbi:YeeE/YedE family protein [Leptothrix ochracea]|uniref:YeeE/YedE family protein n=1 Tax=Leptothrix ochracea TaxID=735331 RepID=UPI0034E24319
MMSTTVQELTWQVLGAVFLLSALLGAVGQRTHFCTMGAVADIVNMGDWSRMRMWAMAAGVAIVGFNTLVALGWVRADQSMYAGPVWQWASALVGGMLFGFGMVLASGCASKTLIRLGAGNLKALVVLLVMGLSAWATLRGITAVLRVATVDAWAWTLPASQDLPHLWAYVLKTDAVRWLAGGLGLIVGGGLLMWSLAHEEGRTSESLLGGLATGGVIVAVWYVSGVWGHLIEHPETLLEDFVGTGTHRMESLSFVSSVAATLEWLVFFSDSNRHVNLGMASGVGVVVGSAIVAWQTHRFSWEGFRDLEDLRRHLLGAVLMGIGGVTAMGCTIGQGLSGLSTLSLTSLVAVVAIMAGAVAALRYTAWRLERAMAGS